MDLKLIEVFSREAFVQILIDEIEYLRMDKCERGLDEAIQSTIAFSLERIVRDLVDLNEN